MNSSRDVSAISEAIISLNKVLMNPKNSTENPFFKKKYAPLSEILSNIRPIMAELGLVIIQNTTSEENKIGIQTRILHKSGQWIESDIMYIKSDKDTAQGQGSAITYGRRYQLSAMLSSGVRETIRARPGRTRQLHADHRRYQSVRLNRHTKRRHIPRRTSNHARSNQRAWRIGNHHNHHKQPRNKRRAPVHADIEKR